MFALTSGRGSSTEPVARQTPLGWTCLGQVSTEASRTTQAMFAMETEPLEHVVQKFWAFESDVEPFSNEIGGGQQG